MHTQPESIDWQSVERLFHQALEADPQQRSQLLSDVAAQQPELYREVSSLLGHFVADELFLPRIDDDLQAAVKQTMELLCDWRPAEAASTIRRWTTPHFLDESALRSQVATLDPNFVYQELIGHGGMGVVVKVLDSDLDRFVALKLIRDSQFSNRDRERFRRESQAIARLQSDHIVAVHRVNDSEQTPYIMMEWIDGPSLKELLAKRSLRPRFAAEIARQVACGLHTAHQHMLLHRDIKPGNILLQRGRSHNSRWRAKIIDFGLVRKTSHELDMTVESVVLGTPVYMSPEQLLDPQSVDVRSDVYSLGITLYQMLTGEPPFRGAPHMLMRQIDSHPPRPPRAYDDRISRDLESVCLKAIAREPDSRYPSAAAFAEDLSRYLDGRPTLARPASTWTHLSHWAARNRPLALSLAATLLLLLTTAVGSVVVASALWKKNQLIRQQQLANTLEIATGIARATPESIPGTIALLAQQPEPPLDALWEIWQSDSTPRARLNSACALLALSADQHSAPLLTHVIEQIDACVTTPGQFKPIQIALSQVGTEAQVLLATAFERPDASEQTRLKTAMLSLELGAPELVAAVSSDANGRTALIHLLPHWFGDLGPWIDCMTLDQDLQLAASTCLALGQFNPEQFNELEREAMLNNARQLWLHSPDSGVRGAADWLLRAHGLSLQDQQPTSTALQVVEGANFNMIHIVAGSFEMGESDPTSQYSGRALHPVTLTRDYWLADREVSVGEFRRFLDDSQLPELDGWEPDAVISPTTEHPAQKVTWNDAVAYCNWLSSQHGLQVCYELDGELTLEGDNRQLVVPNWVRNTDANGYRLPTGAEFEYAARAGTQSLYSFGDKTEFLASYGTWSNNTRVAAMPCGALMPNPWGLFDMHGNVWEWAEDWWRDYPESMEVDPLGTQPVIAGRAYRGGGVCTFSGYPVSSARGSAPPDSRYNNLGFRVARNFETH